MAENLYTVRIGEHTNLDVSVHADYKPPEHSIRVLHFVNDTLVIGTIVGTNPEVNHCIMTLPMFVDVQYCDIHDEEESYTFTPYLRNIIPFDVNKPIPVTLNMDHCITVAEPTAHLLKNYCHYLFLQKAVSDELNGVTHEMKPN